MSFKFVDTIVWYLTVTFSVYPLLADQKGFYKKIIDTYISCMIMLLMSTSTAIILKVFIVYLVVLCRLRD